MHEELSLKQTQKEWHGTYKAYFIGFVISLALTLASFSLVIFKIIEGQALILTIVSLALIQAIAQLIFFLHAGQEEKPRWSLLVFYFMVLILLIISFGSIWIMHNLNERMMPEMEMSHD